MARPTRINGTVQSRPSPNNNFITGGGTNYLVTLPNNIIYAIFIDYNQDPVFCKSLDGGMTWGTTTVLKNCTCTHLAVWYDRWSNINADLIHVAYTDSGASDVFYRNIDAASSDSLSTEYVIFAGASAVASNGALTIARMIGGNIICVGCIDAAAEIFARKSTDVGVNWSNIAAGYEAATDYVHMMPGWGVDTQDGMMFYWDASATEISVKYYDDTGDSWSEASLATSISLAQASTGFPYMSATVDITNSQNIVCFWTALDSANADLRVFKCTQSAQTETTANCVLNSTDDQAFCGIGIDSSNAWWIAYGGASSGVETFNSGMNIYYKKSVDGGANWGSETILSNNPSHIYGFFVTPRFNSQFVIIALAYLGNYFINAPLTTPHATYQLGM